MSGWPSAAHCLSTAAVGFRLMPGEMLVGLVQIHQGEWHWPTYHSSYEATPLPPPLTPRASCETQWCSRNIWSVTRWTAYTQTRFSQLKVKASSRWGWEMVRRSNASNIDSAWNLNTNLSDLSIYLSPACWSRGEGNFPGKGQVVNSNMLNQLLTTLLKLDSGFSRFLRIHC